MSLTTGPAVLAWMRQTVLGVTPEIRPTQPFRLADGFLRLRAEPLPAFERAFVVEGGPTEDGEWWGIQEERDVNKTFTVWVGYHSELDLRTLEERMARDEEQIVSALLRKTGYPDGVELVSWDGSTIDRAPVIEEPAKILAAHVFVVKYRMTF